MDMVVSPVRILNTSICSADQLYSNVCPDGLGAVAPNLPSSAPPVLAAGSKLPTGVSLTRATAVVSGKTTIFTDTLVPTTTTDSRGVTVIGTITKGLQPTTPFPVTSLTTYTTHFVTSAYPAVMALCCLVFLPGSILQAGIPPAGLPTPFPRLTIHPGGTPEYSSKDDSCETTTVTDFWVSCDESQSSCTTTSSAVLSGCSATPTAYTTSVGCDVFLDDDADQGANGDPGQRTRFQTQTTGGTATSTPAATASQAPAVTATSAYPTHTPGSYTGGGQGYAECYDSSSGDTTEFSYDDYMSVVSHLCVSGRSLLPPNGYVRQIGNGNGYDLYADVSWAPDQTGCPTKASWAIADTAAHQEDCIDDCYGGVWVLKVPNVGCVLMNLYSLHADQSSQQNKRDSASNATLAAPFLGSSNDTMTFRHNLTTVMNFTLGGEFPGRFSAITGHFTSDAVDYVPPFGTPAYGPGNASLADAYGYGASNMSLSPASYGNVTEESL
ncbi:hypothetical protein LTR17_001651 [Elasticomyces elasticus]|nr:hypothetical protein LTR17_001651 [Elasticomyces elasticus]